MCLTVPAVNIPNFILMSCGPLVEIAQINMNPKLSMKIHLTAQISAFKYIYKKQTVFALAYSIIYCTEKQPNKVIRSLRDTLTPLCFLVCQRSVGL